MEGGSVLMSDVPTRVLLQGSLPVSLSRDQVLARSGFISDWVPDYIDDVRHLDRSTTFFAVEQEGGRQSVP